MDPIIFNAEASFIITHRGLVFVGTVLSGKVYSGDNIRIQKDDKMLDREILGIEYVLGTPGHEEKYGLIINCATEEEQKELKEWDINGRQFEIYNKQ